jgi:antitoxin component YwqK of YwqJK toxin-antitoxin module
MKRAVLSGLSLLLFFFVAAQDFTDANINVTDKQGLKQGAWKVFDEEGNLKYSGRFADGIPVGVFTYYYPRGDVKAVLTHFDNGKTVYAKNYYPGGKLMAEGKYVDQKKDSVWHYFNAEDGSLSLEERYVNTIKDGVWKTFYPTGQVAEEIIYRNGVKDGPWVQYFTDGKVKMKTNYVNDEIEGQYLIYHINGTVEVSGTYVKSAKNGTWVYFDASGMMEKKEEYLNGILAHQEIFKEVE